MSIGIRENKDTMTTIDRAELASRVARQARMTSRMQVADANSLAHLKASVHREVSAGSPATRDARPHFFGGERRSLRRRVRSRLSALHLSGREQAAFDQEFNQRRDP